MRSWVRGAITSWSVVLLLGVGPANGMAASPPVHEVIVDTGFFQENFAWNSIDCGTFAIHETVVSARRVATYFSDDTGTLVLVMEHYSWDGLFTNLSTGVTFKDAFAINFKFPIVGGTGYTEYTAAGITARFTIPGQGRVSPTLIGRYVYNVQTDEVLFSAGPHPKGVYAFEQLDPTAFCPLLA